MHNLIIFDKTETEKAIERGETLALFAIGPDGTPLRAVHADGKDIAGYGRAGGGRKKPAQVRRTDVASPGQVF